MPPGAVGCATIPPMSEINIQGVPKGVMRALEARAKEQGRSLEDEVMAILELAITEGAIPPIRLVAESTGGSLSGDLEADPEK